MIRSVIALFLVLAALVGADAGLTICEGSARTARNRVRRLFPPTRRDEKLVRGISITPADGKPAVYALRGDLWRCVSFRDAVCDGQAIDNLLRKLMGGTGVVETTDRGRAEDLGFEGVSRVTVGVAGDDGEWGSFDVGDAAPPGGGCYLRRTDDRELIAFDADVRAETATPARRRVPPLVDRTVVTAAWFARGRGIKSVRCAPTGAGAFSLERRPSGATDQEIHAGKPAWAWFVVREGVPDELAAATLAASYLAFLREAPWIDVADSSRVDPGDFETPRAQVTLVPEEGEALVLSLGSRDVGASANTAVPVKNPFSGAVCAVLSPLAPLLVPRAEQLLPGATGDAWRTPERPR